MARIALRALRYHGHEVDGPLAVFDEHGGSIGRAETNRLVLPDPERTVSRVHARVRWEQGRFTIEDCGFNPLLLNGLQLGTGQRAALAPGDRLSLGGYELAVCDAAELPPPAEPPALAYVRPAPNPLPLDLDPFADLLGLQEPVAPAAARPGLPDDLSPSEGSDTSPPPPPGGGPPLSDLFGLGRRVDEGPSFRDLPHAGTIADAYVPSPAAQRPEPVWFAVTAPARLPSSAQRFVTALAVHAESLRATAELQLQRIGGPLGEPLMDLAPARQVGWRIGAPVTVRLDVHGGRAEPAEQTFEWNGRLHLAAFQVQPDAAATAALELCFHVLLAGVPMGLVPLRVEFAAGEPEPVRLACAAPSSAFASHASADAEAVGLCLSALAHWAPTLSIFQDCLDLRPGEAFKPQLENRIADSEAFLLFWSRRAAASPWVRWELNTARRCKPPEALIPMPLEDPSIAPPPPELADRHWRDRFMVARYGLAQVAAQLAMRSDQAALLAALREGLGVPTLPIEALTPELMRLIGMLLHEAVRGTLDLLHARAALKRSARAEVTLIQANENNPLELSPSVEVALNHLLGPPTRGFLPPERAMRAAYDDLHAHQIGLLLGMKAALVGIVKRLDPAVLEARLNQASAMSAWVPNLLKAKMWDVFTGVYAKISAEAADDFPEFFSKEFLDSYESCIDKLKKDR